MPLKIYDERTIAYGKIRQQRYEWAKKIRPRAVAKFEKNLKERMGKK